jgi:predicted metal-binding membrane protein
VAAVRQLTWRHPEWWCLLLSASAWGILAWMALPRMAEMLFGHTQHLEPHVSRAGPTALAQWCCMVLAMMLPLALGPIRVTAARSLWRRRHRAIAAFLVGYLAVWLLLGLGLTAVSANVDLEQWPVWLSAALGFGSAAVWQSTPVKWRALRRCHRVEPLAAMGRRADQDCFRYGLHIGVSCVLSCWALMVCSLLLGHALPAMAGLSVFLFIERYTVRPTRRQGTALLFGTALVLLVAGLA